MYVGVVASCSYQCYWLKNLKRRFLLIQKTLVFVNEMDSLVFKTRATGF